MNNYVSFLLEADAAKRRLAQLFGSEGQAIIRQRFVAYESSCAARTDTKQNNKTFLEWLCAHRLVRDWTRTAVDRQKLICFVNFGLAATAVGLAVLGWLHLLNSYLILVSVFFIGVGFAFNASAWTSIAPQVVSDAELPSAATLSGLQFNISGIIGPALGGLLVPLAGANLSSL
jgi:Transmembrane secretion effector